MSFKIRHVFASFDTNMQFLYPLIHVLALRKFGGTVGGINMRGFYLPLD